MNIQNWLNLILTLIAIGLATLALLAVAEIWQVNKRKNDNPGRLIVPWALDVIASGLGDGTEVSVEPNDRPALHDFTRGQLGKMRSALVAAKKRGKAIERRFGKNGELARPVSGLVEKLSAQVENIDECIRAVPEDSDETDKSRFTGLLAGAADGEAALIDYACRVIEEAYQAETGNGSISSEPVLSR